MSSGTPPPLRLHPGPPSLDEPGWYVVLQDEDVAVVKYFPRTATRQGPWQGHLMLQPAPETGVARPPLRFNAVVAGEVNLPGWYVLGTDYDILYVESGELEEGDYYYCIQPTYVSGDEAIVCEHPGVVSKVTTRHSENGEFVAGISLLCPRCGPLPVSNATVPVLSFDGTTLVVVLEPGADPRLLDLDAEDGVH